jgi:hypothetical protein
MKKVEKFLVLVGGIARLSSHENTYNQMSSVKGDIFYRRRDAEKFTCIEAVFLKNTDLAVYYSKLEPYKGRNYYFTQKELVALHNKGVIKILQIKE